MTVTFKHVGVRTYDTNRVRQTEQSLTPVGIKTPVEFGENGLLKMHSSVGDQLKDNLKNLISTNHGERVGLFTYGANLQPLLSEFSSREAFDSEASQRIGTAIQVWMPFVEVQGYESKPVLDDNRSLAKITLTLEFSVPRAQVFRSKIQVSLYVM